MSVTQIAKEEFEKLGLDPKEDKYLLIRHYWMKAFTTAVGRLTNTEGVAWKRDISGKPPSGYVGGFLSGDIDKPSSDEINKAIERIKDRETFWKRMAKEGRVEFTSIPYVSDNIELVEKKDFNSFSQEQIAGRVEAQKRVQENLIAFWENYKSKNKTKPMYREVNGDLLILAQEGNFDIIAHQTNCFATWNKGLAKQIKEAYPFAYQVDKETEYGDYNKLGNYSVYTHKSFEEHVPFRLILNIYSQYDMGRDKCYTDYDAMRVALRKINKAYKGKKIGLPKFMGCGLAGGDWSIVQPIIKEELKDMYVTVVNYAK